MKHLSGFLSRYRFFLILLLFDIILLLSRPSLGMEALFSSFDSFLEMLSILPPIFLLMGLMDVWIPKKTLMKYMGRGSGIKGALFSFFLGSFSAGPLYAAFPAAAMFIKKGASFFNVFLFLGTWSAAKLPMMLFEISQLGASFAIARFIFNLLGIIVMAFILEKTSTKEQREQICMQIRKLEN